MSKKKTAKSSPTKRARRPQVQLILCVAAIAVAAVVAFLLGC